MKSAFLEPCRRSNARMSSSRRIIIKFWLPFFINSSKEARNSANPNEGAVPAARTVADAGSPVNMRPSPM